MEFFCRSFIIYIYSCLAFIFNLLIIVFDGHAGARVSAHCAENLLDTIIQSDDFRMNASTSNGSVTQEQVDRVKQGIRDGFLKLDEKMKKLPEVLSGEDKSGSTAVCALISPTHFYFANCGDSRAVLSRSGRAFFSTLDHKPINPQEKERIQKAGGSVMIQRVNGSLAVSRALGDYEYKNVIDIFSYLIYLTNKSMTDIKNVFKMF